MADLVERLAVVADWLRTQEAVAKHRAEDANGLGFGAYALVIDEAAAALRLQQKPVAWRWRLVGSNTWVHRGKEPVAEDFNEPNVIGSDIIVEPLYAGPPAQTQEMVAWADVPGFEGLYQISDQGDLRSVRSGKVLAKNLAGDGYVKADLWRDNQRTQTTIHRLVAAAFVPGSGDEVNHKNGIKTDNRASNLEWCSRSENVVHSYYELGKKVRPVVAWNEYEVRQFRSVCEAERFGFFSAAINLCLKGEQNMHKGYRWRDATASEAQSLLGATPMPVQQKPVGQLYRCEGCGRETFDPVADLLAIQGAGGIACCPEREMQPVPATPMPVPHGWQPIETAPKGERVLLWSSNWLRWHIADWAEHCVYNSSRYTHWIPLPAAPAQSSTNEDETHAG